MYHQSTSDAGVSQRLYRDVPQDVMPQRRIACLITIHSELVPPCSHLRVSRFVRRPYPSTDASVRSNACHPLSLRVPRGHMVCSVPDVITAKYDTTIDQARPGGDRLPPTRPCPLAPSETTP